MKKIIKVLTIILLFLIQPAFSYSKTVRVGFYENNPKVFTAKDGKPSGIFIDIIKHIAGKEKWKLVFVHGNWDECLDRLKDDKIDLMLDIACSKDREKVYDFNENDVFANWAQVYTRSGFNIKLITDLNNKKIATLRSGIHEIRFQEIADGFGLKYELVKVGDYKTIFELLQEGKVDAGVVNRVFGMINRNKYNVIPTTIIFSPASLRYAVKKGSNKDILEAIDKHLVEMKKSKNSAYHQSLKYWLGETTELELPGWISWALTISVIGIILFLLVTILLKYQVNRKTKSLLKTNMALEKQVRETMKAHLQLEKSADKLIQQGKMSALAQLSSGIAHDFNNQLIPVLGYSDLILANPQMLDDKNEIIEILKVIKDSAIVSRELITRLQEFKKATPVGKMEKVNINELFSDVINTVQPLWKNLKEAESISIEINKEVSEGLNAIFNKNQVKEALINLLINSLYAIKSNGKIILKGYVEKSYLYFEVKDNGEGMSKETKMRCLEPFYTTKGDKGTGMGLSMVYGIMENHNGEVIIDSELKRGTTIILKIPLFKEEIPGMPSLVPFPAIIKNLRVLVVDDDVNSRNLISKYLKLDDHTVETASNILEAKNKFNKNIFDIVITDYAMPGGNGAELAKYIKSVNNMMPVIMISGFAKVLDSLEKYPKGIDYLLGKPFTLEELRQVINSITIKK